MKKRMVCLVLVLFLTACEAAPPNTEVSGIQFYYPAQSVSYQDGGAICSQDAGLDAAGLTPEKLLEEYLNTAPPADADPPVPQEWSLQSVEVQDSSAVLVFGGKPVGALRRSLAATCLTMTLLQLDTVQRVSITTPESPDSLLLTENDIFLRDTGMLPQEEILVLYFPDSERRYLQRETRIVEVMEDADKPAYIVRQILENDCIPAGTQLLGLHVENGVCTVNLSSQFESGMDGSFTAERMAVYSIVDSLTELPEITTVDLWVAGAPLERLRWMELGSGISRDESLIAVPADGDITDITLYPTCTDSGLLVAIPQMLTLGSPRQTAELALNALFAFEGTNGVRSCIPEGTKLLTLRVEDGTCVVDLTGEFLDGCADAEEETLAVRSIVATMYALPGITSVEIFVEGIEPTYRDDALRTVRRSSASWFAP